jgi:hypothetical protein
MTTQEEQITGMHVGFALALELLAEACGEDVSKRFAVKLREATTTASGEGYSGTAETVRVLQTVLAAVDASLGRIVLVPPGKAN